MNLQTLITVSAAALSALYFLRGVYRDLSGGAAQAGGRCGKCSSGGCSVASKG